MMLNVLELKATFWIVRILQLTIVVAMKVLA
jgi:hypothetical protein